MMDTVTILVGSLDRSTMTAVVNDLLAKIAHSQLEVRSSYVERERLARQIDDMRRQDSDDHAEVARLNNIIKERDARILGLDQKQPTMRDLPLAEVDRLMDSLLVDGCPEATAYRMLAGTFEMKIMAIRYYRQRTNVSLREAKDAVEGFLTTPVTVAMETEGDLPQGTGEIAVNGGPDYKS